MPTRLSDEEFTARFDLADWRVESGRLEVVYRLQTYEAAATLVLDIARAAEAAMHHPDIDLRYPGRVHVHLMTHAVGGLTELDAGLAATITRLAALAEATAEPVP